MRGIPLTPVTVLPELERLLRVHKRPAHAPADAEMFARDYTELCGDVSLEQFRQAVTEYLRGPGRFFPKPGELRALALQQPGADTCGTATGWEQWLANGYRSDPNGPLSACPACGRDWEWTPRGKIIHRHVVHRALGLPCIGHCDAPFCAGPGRVARVPVAASAVPTQAVLLEDERAAIQSESALPGGALGDRPQ